MCSVVSFLCPLYMCVLCYIAHCDGGYKKTILRWTMFFNLRFVTISLRIKRISCHLIQLLTNDNGFSFYNWDNKYFSKHVFPCSNDYLIYIKLSFMDMGIQKISETEKLSQPTQSETTKDDNQKPKPKKPSYITVWFWFLFSNIIGYPNKTVFNIHIIYFLSKY